MAALAGASALVVGLGAWRARVAIAAALARAAGRLAAAPGRWLLFALVLGLVLRAGWMAAAPTPFRSDGRAYANLAEALASGRSFSEAGFDDVAYWPPGYPFALAPLVALAGGSRAAVLGANLALFALLLAATWALGRRTVGAGATLLACLLLAVWPNLVTLAATPSKELLLAVLLPAALALVDAAAGRATVAAAAGRGVAAGAALGAATLTQPGNALLALPLAALLGLTGVSRRASSAAIAGLLVAQLAVVLPWLARNQRVVGAPVLTTAAGSIFHRANHAGATGEHVPESATPLAGLPELERSRRGFALGRAWIAENPGAFGVLALRKLVVFLGDDGDGIYHTLRQRPLPRPVYAAARGIALAFWWLLWVAILLAWGRHGEGLVSAPALAAGALALLYLAAVDAVFEAGGRHHVPLAAVLALLAAAAAARLPDAAAGEAGA